MLCCSAAVYGRRWSLPVSARVSRAIWRSCVFQCLDCYTVSFTATGLCYELAQRKRDCERSMPGLTVSAHAWGDCSGERFVVYNTEKRSQNVWNTFVWSCPTWPSRWGMRISIDWPRLKSCQAVCDECMGAEIYSSLSRDAGCSAMWTWGESRVTKIWGSEHDHGFVLFLFATTGFHIARSGIFWTPTFVL